MAAEGAEPGGGDNAPEQALLLLLLQHEAGRNQSVVCKLLATSNATRSAVLSWHCSGQVAVLFDATTSPGISHSAQQAKESTFKAWLLKHSGLLRALRVEGYDGHLDSGDVVDALSQAVNLESFGSSWDDDTSAKVLSALPATLLDLQIVLTEFEPEWEEAYNSTALGSMDSVEAHEFAYEIENEQMEGMQHIRNKHDNPAMVQALQRFTRLRSLHIGGDVSLRPDSPVMQGLSGLTALTRLSISSVLPNLEQLHHLPAHLSGSWSSRTPSGTLSA